MAAAASGVGLDISMLDTSNHNSAAHQDGAPVTSVLPAAHEDGAHGISVLPAAAGGSTVPPASHSVEDSSATSGVLRRGSRVRGVPRSSTIVGDQGLHDDGTLGPLNHLKKAKLLAASTVGSVLSTSNSLSLHYMLQAAHQLVFHRQSVDSEGAASTSPEQIRHHNQRMASGISLELNDPSSVFHMAPFGPPTPGNHNGATDEHPLGNHEVPPVRSSASSRNSSDILSVLVKHTGTGVPFLVQRNDVVKLYSTTAGSFEYFYVNEIQAINSPSGYALKGYYLYNEGQVSAYLSRYNDSGYLELISWDHVLMKGVKTSSSVRCAFEGFPLGSHALCVQGHVKAVDICSAVQVVSAHIIGMQGSSTQPTIVVSFVMRLYEKKSTPSLSIKYVPPPPIIFPTITD